MMQIQKMIREKYSCIQEVTYQLMHEFGTQQKTKHTNEQKTEL